MKTMETHPGQHIHAAINDAIEAAIDIGEHVRFEFNGVTIEVSRDSDPTLILRDWDRALAGCMGSNVTIGPYPKKTLSQAEIDADARVRMENECRQAAKRAEYDRKQQEKTKSVAEMLEGAPAIQLRDQAAWDNCVRVNSDPYGSAAIRYAERWARLMQIRIADGEESLLKAAKETMFVADTEGITGFMHGCARSLLADAWIHGAELRSLRDQI